MASAKSTRLVNIDNVGLENPKIAGDQVMLEFTTTATAYAYLEET